MITLVVIYQQRLLNGMEGILLSTSGIKDIYECAHFANFNWPIFLQSGDSCITKPSKYIQLNRIWSMGIHVRETTNDTVKAIMSSPFTQTSHPYISGKSSAKRPKSCKASWSLEARGPVRFRMVIQFSDGQWLGSIHGHRIGISSNNQIWNQEKTGSR